MMIPMFYMYVQLLNARYLILQKPSDLDIIDCIKYDRHEYDMLLGNACYEHSLNVI